MYIFPSLIVLLGSVLGLSSGSATPPEGCPKCECPAPEPRGGGGNDPLMARSLDHVPIEYEDFGPSNQNFMRMEDMSRMFSFMLAAANSDPAVHDVEGAQDVFAGDSGNTIRLDNCF